MALIARCFLLLLIFAKITQQEILDVKQFLYKNNYSSSPDMDKESLKMALIKFQNSSGLPMSGEVDAYTANKMSIPRCGKAAHIKTDVISQKGDLWKKRSLTYKIRNATEPFGVSQIRTFFENAIEKWTKNTDLKIEESQSDEADIDLFFTQQDGKEQNLGYAYYPEFGDIFIDKEEAWSVNSNQSADMLYLGWIVAHELGHALGFDHDNENLNSIMFPAYNTKQLEPSAEDRNNLVWVYGGEPTLDHPFCSNTSVDALLYTNEQRHILTKGDQFWSFDQNRLLGGPFSLRRFYPELPDKVDAAFASRKYTYFFKDTVFYRYSASDGKMKKKSISRNFEKGPSNIDAAFYYPSNTSFYFFKGDAYYVFNPIKEEGRRMVTENVKISEDWSGVPDNIDAATFLGGDRALFIKNLKCYWVDLQSRKVEKSEDCTSNFYRCQNED